MSDERARILKLLEDGKVTAEQAARLIEALGAQRSECEFGPAPPFRSRHFRRHLVFKDLERIPDVVAGAVTSAMRSGFECGDEQTSDFPGKRDLFVKSVSGDIEVAGRDEDRVSVSYSGGMVKVRTSGEQVLVRSISGDIDAQVPPKAELEFETVSGDVSVDGVGGKVRVKAVSGDVDLSDSEGDKQVSTVSGNVELTGADGELDIETRSGDIEVAARGQVSGRLSSKSGDITLSLCPSADVVVEMTCEEDGDIRIDVGFPHDVVEQRAGYAKVKFGAGSRTMRIRTRSADITVEELEEAE